MYNSKTHDLIITNYPGCYGKIKKIEKYTEETQFYSDGKDLKYFDMGNNESNILEGFNHMYYDTNFKICFNTNEYLENMGNVGKYIDYKVKEYSFSRISNYLSEKESNRLFEDLELNVKFIFENELYYRFSDIRINEIVLLYKNKLFRLDKFHTKELNEIKNNFNQTNKTNDEIKKHKAHILDYFLINSN